MTFQQATAFKMPFGKHRGKTLGELAAEDDGLRYMGWLLGEKEKGADKRNDVLLALQAYLSDPSIKKEQS